MVLENLSLRTVMASGSMWNSSAILPFSSAICTAFCEELLHSERLLVGYSMYASAIFVSSEVSGDSSAMVSAVSE